MIIGRLKEMMRGWDGEWTVSFTTRSDLSETFNELSGKDVKIDIKRYSKQRSLTANAYAWVLIDQITAKLQDTDRKGGWTPEKVYKNAIREIGGISETVGMRDDAIETFRGMWCKDHLGRQVQVLPGSSKPGWSNVKVWYGSSDFDTAQMARLIDSLIQDAEALGIPTITQKEYEELLKTWGQKRKE